LTNAGSCARRLSACPLTIAYPTLGEADHPSTIGINTVAKVDVLYLNLMLASHDGSNDVFVLTDEGKGRIILDPAQHVRYTGCVHKLSPYGPGSGVLAHAGAIPLSAILIILHLSVFCLVKYGDYLYNLRMRYGVCTTPNMEVNVERLRALRVEHVLTLRELAEAAGVSKDTIWRLENGHSDAHPSTIRKLARALEVHPKELVKTGA
jgi:DNA-binding XRE family transcriptional regulator